MPAALVLDDALDADALARLHRLARAAPLRCYVEGPRTDALAAGLTRRHDVLLRHLQALAARGEVPDMATMGGRSNLFRRVWAERGVIHEPQAAPLLHHVRLRDAVAPLLGGSVEPTMLYVNVLLPGQSLMPHTDTPEFVGLDKQDVPEWLLVCMLHSGRFDAARIPIAGGVVFLGAVQGGAFRWDDGGPQSLPVADNRAILLDADRTPHAVDPVGPPDAPAPPVTPDSTLTPVGGAWVLHDPQGAEVGHYASTEVRVSVQYKARGPLPEVAPLTPDDAIAGLSQALVDRGEPVPTDPTERAMAFIEAFAPDAAGLA